MRARIQKWGNSLAVRIPKSYARDVQIEWDSVVDIALVNGKIIIQPVKEAPLSLDDLLASVTDENIHEEIDMGPPAGAEVW